MYFHYFFRTSSVVRFRDSVPLNAINLSTGRMIIPTFELLSSRAIQNLAKVGYL